MNLFHQLFFITLLLFGSAASAEVVLTITGEIGSPNRGGRDDFQDVLFKKLDIPFTQAREVTLKEIQALPQHTLDVQYESWPKRANDQPHQCEGPTLKDVVDLAKPAGKVLKAQALDGYAWSFDQAKADFSQILVTHTLDGSELAIGGRGPLMLCMKPELFQASSEADAALIWALFHIQVQP